MAHLRSRRFPALVVSCLLGASCLLPPSNPAQAHSRPAASIPAANLIQPADLAAELLGDAAPKPLIFQVGFRTLYAQAHIPGAEYVGAAGDDQGLRALRDRSAKLPKDAAIVIYCGCCPWSHCPNIAAAFAALHGLGFAKVRVLYIANNFGTDWVDKGYPVVKGT
jgi:thiosulfate/3-mercaptopyruvate sulfurtransferase